MGDRFLARRVELFRREVAFGIGRSDCVNGFGDFTQIEDACKRGGDLLVRFVVEAQGGGARCATREAERGTAGYDVARSCDREKLEAGPTRRRKAVPMKSRSLSL
jgi:hypothetical protein